MSRHLPPLNAVRAFEAAARHLSFAKAADELAVTPAAISHQIRLLEEWLGVKLFVRMTRKVALTQSGRSCLPSLTQAFDQIDEAMARIGRGGDQDRVLTLSVVPSFAAKWLVPNIESFNREHPDIDVRISANPEIVDFRSGDVDIAIRCGTGHYPGLEIDTLFMEEYAPLCSPDLLNGPHELRSPSDLEYQTLLHHESDYVEEPAPDWRMWLKLEGVEEVYTNRGPRFSCTDHALQAAIEGQGVLLGRLSLAQADIEAGRLVRPFGTAIPSKIGYFLVRPRGRTDRQRVSAFREWILSKIRGQKLHGEEG